VLNEFVLVNTANGLNLYLGTKVDLYREGTGWRNELWRVSGDSWSAAHNETVNPLRVKFGEVGANRALSDLTVSYIIQNPSIYLLHKLHTLYRYVFPNLNAPVHLVPGFVNFGNVQLSIHVLFVLGIINVVISRNIKWLMLLTCWLFMVVSSSLVFFSERFVVITIPLYFLFTVKGLFVLGGWMKRLIWKRDIVKALRVF
jgi:hypothetical protein